MQHQQIRDRVDELNRIIEENLTPSHFELNKTVQQAIDELNKIQSSCEHNFDENGVCQFCLKEK